MTEEVLVAIHQPNFFPWLGFFDKIARADVFVVLDSVQFPKTGGTWINRVRLLVNGQPAWVTMPVVRAYHGVRLIREMQIDNGSPWRKKLLQSLRTNYARAPHFKAVFPEVVELVEFQTESLLEFNMQAIVGLCRLMGISTAGFVLGSSLSLDGQATELLIDAVAKCRGTAYLCGAGAGGYQQDEQFAAAGLRLSYQSFLHPVYPQGASGDFIPGLSCLDALMHCGVGQVSRFFERETRP